MNILWNFYQFLRLEQDQEVHKAMTLPEKFSRCCFVPSFTMASVDLPDSSVYEF